MREYPVVEITHEMLDHAVTLVHTVRAVRSDLSALEAIVTVLGEFVVAEHLFSDWRKHQVETHYGSHGRPEVTTVAEPFDEKLHIHVRDEHVAKRKHSHHIMVVLDISDPKVLVIRPGTRAYVCGFATPEQMGRAPHKVMGGKIGGWGGSKYRRLRVLDLHPMHGLPADQTRLLGKV
jgi:hypothetical protein